MKAFISEKYGPPEMLRMAEVEKPVPVADEALVKVLAVSVNPADWRSMRAKPFFSRATLGLLRPKHRILGVDIAGRVEAVGSGVTQFKPGDEVYANLLDHGLGGFAEYVSVPVEVMSWKPANLSFEAAAAVPMAAVTALQGLRYHGEIQAGQRVLINGASGGIGTFAVQIAKSYGSEVTGVTSTRNIDLVASLGADHVIDYTTTDFFRGGRRYDLILDTIGNLSVRNLKRALAEGGKAAVVGFTSVAKLLSVSLRGGRNIAQVSAHVAAADLEFLANLIEAGKIAPTSTGAIGSPKSPQQSPTWNKATPEGRSSSARRDLPSVRPLTRPATSPRRLRLVESRSPTHGSVRRTPARHQATTRRRATTRTRAKFRKPTLFRALAAAFVRKGDRHGLPDELRLDETSKMPGEPVGLTARVTCLKSE
jgi:NADPH:quinone reductase-like Zn-dependent oxidoreductase